MNIFEREVGGHTYRIASQSLWDPVEQRPFARQAVLGSADPPPVVDLGQTRTDGHKRIGDVAALLWVAEQLDVVSLINLVCGFPRPARGPTVGEWVLAVAVQRACAPGPKCEVAGFLEGCLPLVSCLPAAAFTGQSFHRVARQVKEDHLERVQIELARAAIRKFDLVTDVLAFDTTNFDTYIATTTTSDLAARGHAKSKRSDLRVVGLAVLVSETGHVPLLHRTYPGNGSDQEVLTECLEALGQLHAGLEDADELPSRRRPSRTLVRDGGSWSPQLELDLEEAGYHTIISLPLSHNAAEEALEYAARPRAMKRLRGKLGEVRAACLRTKVGELDRTLVVVESPELLRGQKRGVAAALRRAKNDLRKLAKRAEKRKVVRALLEDRVKTALSREHLSAFVTATIRETDGRLGLTWVVDAARRRRLERTRLGRRVLCTDHHTWSAGRIVHGFRGQWKVEELFRRAKKGGVVPWGPSHQWTDTSLRLHSFATVIGLELVSLARLALGTRSSARGMMKMLGEVQATVVRVGRKGPGRRATVLLPPDLSAEQRRAAKRFDFERWLPHIISSRSDHAVEADNRRPE